MSDALFGWWSPDWRTRQALAADADIFAALHAGCFSRAWDAEDFESLLSEPNVVGHLLCPHPGTPMVGFALSRIAADEAEILSIGVVPSRRAKGGGHCILATHLNALANRGAGSIFLEVDEDNLPANKLYAGFGFREVGRRQAYYTRADGTRGTARVLSASIR